MGHKGIATSFYTERDEPLAGRLVRLLLENKQEIPDFLEPFLPEGDERTNLKWEEASNPEDRPAEAAGFGDGAWGADGGDGAAGGDDAVWGNDANENGASDVWGASAPAGDDAEQWK